MELQSMSLLLGEKIAVSGVGKEREGKALGKSNSRPVVEEPHYLCIYYVAIDYTVYSAS